MKKKLTIGILLVLLTLLLSGAIFVALWSVSVGKEEQQEPQEELVDLTMFSSITTCEIFQNIPKMICDNAVYSEAEDYGNGDWLISVNGSTLEEYQAYLKLLEQSGFKKHSDNGEDAMEGYVYTASYTKEDITYTLSHVLAEEHTYLVASRDEDLSPHLIYQDSYLDGIKPGAETKLHMLELHHIGNSFVIQLKNGHFVVFDGGQAIDAPYLLDYLESLTPDDEIPVVEGWFFSHAHSDHTGALIEITGDQTDVERIRVNGIYFTEPKAEYYETFTYDDDMDNIYLIPRLHLLLKDENGEQSRGYRMHLGQRYYFCDIVIDVALTLEQFVEEAYYETDFNDTSTWLMTHIDGQRFLCAGDANNTAMREAMAMYDKDYFNLDVFAVFHHGMNVHNYWTDYCTIKTTLYTFWRAASIWNAETDPILGRKEGNAHLKEVSKEYVSHGGGTVVLTFPYAVGTYEKLEPCDWRYDGGVRKGKELSSGTQ